jgi:hypothetical protein
MIYTTFSPSTRISLISFRVGYLVAHEGGLLVDNQQRVEDQTKAYS